MQEELEKAFLDASNELAKVSKEKSRTRAHEIRYGRAYQNLVNAGFRQQIKKKYRVGGLYAPGNALG